MPKPPPYIHRRRNRYYAALNIPKELRRHYPGKSPGKTLYKLVQSLETDSLVVAKRRVSPVISAWQSEFARLRREPEDDTAYFRRRLKKAKTEAERKRIMVQIDTQAENLANPSLSHSADDRPDDYSRYQEAEQAALERATDFYDRATGEIVGFTDHVDDWLERSAVTQKTKDMSRADVMRFAGAFPTIQEVTHEQVQRWIDRLGLAPKTTKRVLGALRGYWKYLQRHDVKAAPKDFMPFSGLDLPKRKGNGRDRKPFAPRDVVRLWMRAHEDQQLCDLIRLAMWTGCRIEELCSLTVKHVHKNYIEIEDAKTPAGWRQVPIHRALKDTLTRLVKNATDGYVLSGLTENKYGDRSNAVGKRFGRLKSEMGFGTEHVFHSIRMTVSTLLENAGVPENVAADILGHEKPRITYGLYSGGTSLEVKAVAIAKLSYGAKKKAA